MRNLSLIVTVAAIIMMSACDDNPDKITTFALEGKDKNGHQRCHDGYMFMALASYRVCIKYEKPE